MYGLHFQTLASFLSVSSCHACHHPDMSQHPQAVSLYVGQGTGSWAGNSGSPACSVPTRHCPCTLPTLVHVVPGSCC